MYINSKDITGRDIGVMPIYPSGANDTMFTECCEVAICDSELRCPECKKMIIGHNAKSNYWRGRARFHYATKHWDKTQRRNP